MQKLLLFLFFIPTFLIAQEPLPPSQSAKGPGGMEYVTDSVAFYDFAEKQDGYWLFQPIADQLEEAPVVVFIHGYGALNPMVYGDWIEHLVKKGNIVIYPRYQKGLLSPKPKHFTKNVAIAIQNALQEMEKEAYVRPTTNYFSVVGHSYGGVIAANLAVNFDTLQIPEPKAVMLCSPGSGPFKGGVLDSYESMSPDLNLLVMVSEDDKIVKDKLGKKVFQTAKQVRNRNFIRQFADKSGKPAIKAGHNESYSLNKTYDSGVKNMTVKRAKRKTALNAVDFYGYWKLFDALLACTGRGEFCDTAFGDTPQQKYMGHWSNGEPVKPLEVTLPEPIKVLADY